MNKRIIVTGILGQDGATMAEYLLRDVPGCKVIGVYRRTTNPDFKNIELIPKDLRDPERLSFAQADITDEVSINELVLKYHPDYFINFAANSFVAASWKTPVQVMDVNTLGVLRCLEAIRKHKPDCRFYSAGSSEEFGDVEYSPQDEAHPIRPRSPYGASKAAARHLVKVYRESYGLYAIHGTLFNHEGIRRGEEFVTRKITKGVARIKKEIESGLPVTPLELGNVDAKRDWSDAEDFVDGVWRMLNQEKYRGNVNTMIHNFWTKNDWLQEYVLASGETHSIREFVTKAFAAAGIEGYWHNRYPTNTTGLVLPDNLHGPMQERFYRHDEVIEGQAEYEGDASLIDNNCTLVQINPEFYRPADVEILQGDSTKIRDQLKWEPRVTFDVLVKKMVERDLLLV